MKQEQWLTVTQYAKLVGKSRQQIYMDIRLGKIKHWKKIKVEEIRIKAPVDKS
jgi:hypothetical protein